MPMIVHISEHYSWPEFRRLSGPGREYHFSRGSGVVQQTLIRDQAAVFP
jgi:hypothetical protein